MAAPKGGDSRSADGKPMAASKNKSAPPATPDARPNADAALALLREGNARWAGGRSEHPNSSESRRELTASEGQRPFVTVLTCADSRVPVERVFDRGVGDVFSVRVAGNVAGVSEVGTIEYGVEHLGTPLLVVMGHTKCGAVAAAASHAETHGSVGDVVRRIAPAVERAERVNPGVDGAALASAAVKENVWQSVFDLLKGSDELRRRVASGELQVVGAVYDLSTGRVDFLGEHPWQSELLTALRDGAVVEPTRAGVDSAGVVEHPDH
ncbi:MAG: carbonic anhydrase [Phycisphaerae bacterium]|nr:carbonic anhydrase [Phycisphaerae bacterium]